MRPVCQLMIFSTLYTTLPHNLIKEKLINLIEWTFKREGSPYIACNERQAFFTSEDTKRYKLWSCQNVCEALIYLLDNIYIRFGTKLYRQIVGIPMGTNCAPLVADLFLFCYERDFMTSLSDVKQAEIIEAFKSTSRYLDDLLNIDNPYFEGMVNRIYPPELQLNKANTADTEAPFLDLHLSISNGFVSSKIYDKRDDFDFDIVNFPFLDGDVPRSTSYGVYISQLIRFARVSSHVVGFNARNKSLTAKLLQQGYRYHKLRKTFSKFYRRHYELVSKFNVGLKTLLHRGLSEPEFYGDLVYKFKKIVGGVDFCDQFRGIIVRYKRVGCSCVLGVWPGHGWWLCFPLWLRAGGSGVGLGDGPDIKLFVLVGLGRSFFVCCLAHRGSTIGFLLLQCSGGVVRRPGDLRVSVAAHFCRVLIFASS